MKTKAVALISLPVLIVLTAGFLLLRNTSSPAVETPEILPPQTPQQELVQTNLIPSSKQVPPTNKPTDLIASLKVGDKFGNFTITKIEALNTSQEIWMDNAVVSLKGEDSMSGRYVYHTSTAPFGLENQVCIIATDITGLQALKLNGWLCFTNQSFAQAQLGPQGSEGEATVVIKNLMLTFSGSETTHEAELVKVLHKSQN